MSTAPKRSSPLKAPGTTSATRTTSTTTSTSSSTRHQELPSKQPRRLFKYNNIDLRADGSKSALQTASPSTITCNLTQRPQYCYCDQFNRIAPASDAQQAPFTPPTLKLLLDPDASGDTTFTMILLLHRESRSETLHTLRTFHEN
jgi:hypothetical protein